jgi:hypothetical protein
MSKITAGKTNQKSTGIVFVVQGIVDYEGSDTLAVTTSKKLALLMIDTDKAFRKAMGRFPYDSYNMQKFQLDTAEYRTEFGMVKTVRPL